MTLQQLEVFVQVVESGSFTKAGQLLSLTQSAISHIVSALEAELGFTLLYRNRSGISMTTEGQKMYQHALDMLKKAELIKQEAAAIVGVESGILKVGCFPSLSANKLPDIIVNFQEKYPRIELKIYEGNYYEIEEWIAAGTIDLGFSAIPHESFDFIPLWEDEMVVIVSPDHPFSTRDTVSIEEIEAEPCIMPKYGCDVLIKQICKENNVHPSVKYEMEDNNTILAMVSKGLGISIVPKMVLHFGSFPCKPVRLVPRSFRTVGILLKSYEAASPASLAFIREVQSMGDICC